MAFAVTVHVQIVEGGVLALTPISLEPLLRLGLLILVLL